MSVPSQSAADIRRMPFVCDTGTREQTNIERAIEIAGVTPKLKFVAGGRLLSRGIRWPAFPLAGDRLVSRGIRFGGRWPAYFRQAAGWHVRSCFVSFYRRCEPVASGR